MPWSSISDQELDRYLQVHEQVAGLLSYPRSGWALGEVEKVNPPSDVFNAENT